MSVGYALSSALAPVQTQLNVDSTLVLDLVVRRAPQRFPSVTNSPPPANASGFAADCPSLLDECITSPQLNPFQRGVDTNFTYGAYLSVAPFALQAYYSNTFLGRLANCAGGSCSPQPAHDLQARALRLL
jgi:hypothetical protein